MKRITALLLLLFLPAILWGQSTKGIISGTIIDQDEEPVPNASVAVYDSTESEIITGVSSNIDGEFEIEVDPGSYVLQITFLSFEPLIEPIEIEQGEETDLGTLSLNPTSESLGEVVVEGERSQMEMSFDKRIFQVGSDITSLGGSAVNVLDNVPSIETDIDGNISLRGNESVRVLINGKPSSMVSDDVDALRSIPATMIKEVEIITNPSSKYAAEGSAGIINIILVEDKELGINGNFSAGTGYPQNHDLSTNINYRRGNINWFLGGSIDYRSRPQSGSSFHRFAGADTAYMYDRITDATDSEIDGSVRFGADIHLSENELLRANTYINLEQETDLEDLLFTDMEYEEGAFNGDVIERTDRESEEVQNERDIDFNLDYENKFDGDEHKLTADASFDISRERANGNIEEVIQQGSGTPLLQRTVDKEKEFDLRLNAEYIRPLGENGKLETGFRSDAEWMDNFFEAEEQSEDGSWQEVEGNYNDNFLYFENVNAAYAIVGSEWRSFSGQVGLRAENTRIHTELISTDDETNQNYLGLFPTAFLNYAFNDQQSVQLSYSRRLRRPWSRMLLPFSNFTDNRTQSTGNPDLRPEFSNSYEAGYLHYWNSGSLMTSFYYRHRSDVIERITEEEGTVTRRYPINLATEKAWGIELSADQKISNSFTFTGSANLYRANREGSYQDQIFDSETESLNARMRLRWEIIDGFQYQSSLRYSGPRATTQGRRDGMAMMDAGMAYELMDGKARVSLNIRDVFNSRNFNNIVTTDGNPNTDFYSAREFNRSSRSFSLNFTYFFGEVQNRRGQRRR